MAPKSSLDPLMCSYHRKEPLDKLPTYGGLLFICPEGQPFHQLSA